MLRAGNGGACRRSNGSTLPMHEGVRVDAAKVPEYLLRADIGGAVGVPMHEHTTAGAAQHAPPWCGRMTMAAGRAGAGRVRFVDHGRSHPNALGLLGEVGAELPVGPLAELLIGVLALRHAIADVAALFTDARSAQQTEYGMTSVTETTGGHGRVETRTAYVISDPAVIAYLNPGNRWRDLASVALVEAQRTADGQTTTEQRSYLLDQVRSPREVHALVRGHWGMCIGCSMSSFTKMPAAFGRAMRRSIWAWCATLRSISCARSRAKAA